MKKEGLWVTDGKFLSFAELENLLRGEVTSRKQSAGYFSQFLTILPDPDEVLNKFSNAVTTYNKMTFDPHIFAEMEKRKALTTSLQFEIVKGNSSEKYFNIIKDYFLSNDSDLFSELRKDNLDDEDADIYDLLEIGLDAVFHGYQPCEIIWDMVGSIRLPAKIIDRPREWFQFDDENKLRFKSKNAPLNGELLPEKKILLFRHKPRYDNPYGTRVLSRCFWPWTFKHSTEKWKIQFLEKFGAVWALGKLPRGKENAEYNNMYDALLDLINSQVGIIPDDGSVEVIEPAGKGTTANIFDGNINLYNSEISKAILTVTSLTGTEDKGSYASDQVRERMFKAVTASDKRVVTKKINQLFQWIYEVNGWGTPCMCELWESEDYDKERADRDQVLSQQGVRFSKKYYQNKFNLEEDDFEVSEPAQQQPFNQPLAFATTEVNEEKQLLKSISSEKLQTLIEPIIKDVLKVFKESASFEEAMQKTIELIPDANTDDFVDLVTALKFTGFIKGSIDAKQQ